MDEKKHAAVFTEKKRHIQTKNLKMVIQTLLIP